MLNTLTRLFPLWAILLSIFAYLAPELFVDFKPWIVPLLSLIMFGMGLSLKLADFLNVLTNPKVILIGLLLQFLLMPFYAWGIAEFLQLSPLLLAGMVLVGSSPGGTASNVITYLAKGNLALSVTLTSCSTLLAVVATPYLTLLYAGQAVSVDVLAMLLSVLKMVLLPVLAGLLINTFFAEKMSKVKDAFPLISVAAIVFIIAIVVALNHERLGQVGMLVLLAVILHNLLGLMSGYIVPRLLGYDKKTARTLSIEVGMQNSGLAVALAGQYFAAIAALPGAIFSVWHNLSGSLLAFFWVRNNKS
jgi:BASS family bile acid:Na+ symporter